MGAVFTAHNLKLWRIVGRFHVANVECLYSAAGYPNSKPSIRLALDLAALDANFHYQPFT